MPQIAPSLKRSNLRASPRLHRPSPSLKRSCAGPAADSAAPARIVDFAGLARVARYLLPALLALLLLGLTPQRALADWPSIPSDDEINQAAVRFIQENSNDNDVEDCAAIADANEQNLCWTRRSMNNFFGPNITLRTEIVDASTLKIHHTAQTDPLAANAVILLYTQVNTNETVAGAERSEDTTYHTAVLLYSADPADPDWRFEANHWWPYDEADLDQSLGPRERRDAKVQLLFRPLDARGYYGWAHGFLQGLSVTGYDGESDPLHMPLTFWIKAEDEAGPRRGMRTPFAVEGEVRCLADRYAVWDTATGQWTDAVHNFAAGPVQYGDAPQTDANGLVVVRLFLDYGRMRLFDLQLPCHLDFAAYAPDDDSAQTFQKTETSLDVRSPAFVRGAFYQVVTREGAATRRQIVNAAQLGDGTTPFIPGQDASAAGAGLAFEEPTKARVLSRISLNGQPLVPPATADYYVPIPSGGQLIVDGSDNPLLVDDGSGRTWAPRRGDGIGVMVMWLDGSTGLLLVNNRTGEANSVLAMRVVGSWSTSPGMPLSDDGALALFAVGQGADWVVQKAVVGGATALGGPVAGAWAAVIVGSAQAVGDVDEVTELVQRNRRVIWMRSRVALTSEVDGRNTLYVAEGSPSVENDAGEEVVVGQGQAVEFSIEGEIIPAAQEPSGQAQALLAALPAVAAPIAASTGDAAVTVAAVDSVADTPADSAASGWSEEELDIEGIVDIAPGEELALAEETGESDCSECTIDLSGFDPTYRTDATAAGAADASAGIVDLPADDFPAGLIAGVVSFLLVATFGLLLRGRRRRRAKQTAAADSVVQPTAVAAEPSPAKRARSSSPPMKAAESTAPSRSGQPMPSTALAPTKQRTAVPNPAAAQTGTVICPRCGKPMRADALFCGECGAARQIENGSPAEPPPQPAACPTCGAQVNPGARFCGTCGQPLVP